MGYDIFWIKIQLESAEHQIDLTSFSYFDCYVLGSGERMADIGCSGDASYGDAGDVTVHVTTAAEC